ncbi:MAG: sigma-70 family RNA polymerase sigma factor [Planctomycetota bacterium]
MNERDRLSRIDTLWSVVKRAHTGEEADSRRAQEELLDRYGGAIRRYLIGALRDETLADELYQEFALRFVKGAYATADPERGRFRAFLKTILSRLVIEHHRKRQRRKSIQMGSAVVEPVTPAENVEEEDFAKVWRDELLRKAWHRLQQLEQETSRPLYTVMDSFVTHPELSSAEQADRLTEVLGRPLTAQNVRVILHRARGEFAEFLMAEVRNTLDDPSKEALEEELIELRLHKYCRPK